MHKITLLCYQTKACNVNAHVLCYNDGMKLIKGIVAFILVIVLAVSSAVALGSFAVGEAISEEGVREAIVESDAVGKLTDNIIQQNTINLGGEYGEVMKTVLKSDAMTEFFTEYTASCLQSQIYDKDMEEIGSDDLNQAFSRGMDECLANGSISMNEGERMIFDQALNMSMPALTYGINYVLGQMDLTDFVDEDMEQQVKMAQTAASEEVRYGAALVAIITCLLLLLLYWRSKMGLIVSGIVILAIAALLYLLSMMIEQTAGASGTDIVLSRQMLCIMITYGLGQAIALGAVAGGALVVGFPIFPSIRD